MQENLQSLVETIRKRLFVELEASGRHVHVTRQQAVALFGHPLTPRRPLSQPGQFLSNERLTLRGPKGELGHVAVLGPEREQAQVEISLTDGKLLGVNPPVKPSGDVAGSPGITLVGERGSVELDTGVIAAQRHIHMTPEDAANWKLTDKQRVRLQVLTRRPVIFEDVLVRVSPEYATFVHLDYDEANACGMEPGDLGRILP